MTSRDRKSLSTEASCKLFDRSCSTKMLCPTRETPETTRRLSRLDRLATAASSVCRVLSIRANNLLKHHSRTLCGSQIRSGYFKSNVSRHEGDAHSAALDGLNGDFPLSWLPRYRCSQATGRRERNFSWRFSRACDHRSPPLLNSPTLHSNNKAMSAWVAARCLRKQSSA